MGKCFRVAGRILMLLYGNDRYCEMNRRTSVDRNIEVSNYVLLFNSYQYLRYVSHYWFIKYSNIYRYPLWQTFSHKEIIGVNMCLFPLINLFKATWFFFSWMFWNFDSFIYCLHFINNSQSAVCILSVSLDLMLTAMFSFKQAIKQFKFISSSTSLKYLWSPVRGIPISPVWILQAAISA